MSRYKPYPKYKPSGVEWLGDIPEHWEVKRLKFLARINPTKSEVAHLPPDFQVQFLPMESVGEDGSYSLDSVRNLADVYGGYTYCRNNDVILAKITPCFENGKGALLGGLTNGIAFASTEFHVLRPESSLPRFVWYVTKCIPFRQLGKLEMKGAVGQQRVPDSFVANFHVAAPSKNQQSAIAVFLDRETGRIDALVEKKRRFIELLQEKRQALITAAVTGKFDVRTGKPYPKYKPSGMEWLGDVPEHWEVKRLKFLATCNDETLPDSTPRDYEIQYVDIGNVSHGQVLHQETMAFEKAPSRARRKVRDGDVIVSTVRTYLRAMAVLHEPPDNMIVSTGFAVIRASKVDRHFLAFALEADSFVEWVVAESKGISYPAINASELMSLSVSVPSVQEQSAIAAFLDRETGRIDALVEKTEKSIELLKEKRAALITAAVTGKIDVREEADES